MDALGRRGPSRAASLDAGREGGAGSSSGGPQAGRVARRSSAADQHPGDDSERHEHGDDGEHQRDPPAAALQRPRRREALRKAFDEQLVEPERLLEILESLGPEVAHDEARLLPLLVHQQVACRVRDEHLPAVRSRADPRCAVDGDADVAALAGQRRLAGVDTHPHLRLLDVAPVVLRQGALTGRGAVDRRARAPEGDEERVALGAEDLAAGRRTRRAGAGCAPPAPRRSARVRVSEAGSSSPRCRRTGR